MLLIDFGNSTLKGQYWHQGDLQLSFSCRLDSGWQSRFKSILSDIHPTHCCYALVADAESEQRFLGCLNDASKIKAPIRLRTQAHMDNIQNGYDQPEKLGIDRWLALIASTTNALSIKQSPTDKLIVDAGSAITIDLINQQGRHLGGAILPGFNTSIERFKQMMHTADFNHPEIQNNHHPGSSTEACIHINYTSEFITPSMVDNLIDSWRTQLMPDAILIVTGGDASKIKSRASYPRIEMPDLIFRGMIKQLENSE